MLLLVSYSCSSCGTSSAYKFSNRIICNEHCKEHGLLIEILSIEIKNKRKKKIESYYVEMNDLYREFIMNQCSYNINST